MRRSQGTPAKGRSRLGATVGRVLGLALLLGLAGNLAPAWAGDELFVTNQDSNSVTVYVRNADGNITTVRTLSGGDTGLSKPQFIAVIVSAPIPTLSEWAQIGMAALLVLGGLLALRQAQGAQGRPFGDAQAAH